MGDLHYFLEIEVVRCPDGLLLSQCKYLLAILERIKVTYAPAVHTPLTTKHDLHDPVGPTVDAFKF